MPSFFMQRDSTFQESRKLMTPSKKIIRYGLFLVGLWCTGLGIALTIKAGLGTTPISILPLVVAEIFPISFGTLIALLSLAFIGLEILILGKDFAKEQYIQLLICPFFGSFVDLGLWIFRHLEPVSIFDEILILAMGCIVLGLGVHLQVLGRVIINPGEGVVRAIAYKTTMSFGNVKILFDLSILAIGVVLSLSVLHRVMGVGVGTLVVAVATGTITKGFKWVFEWIGVEWLYE